MYMFLRITITLLGFLFSISINAYAQHEKHEQENQKVARVAFYNVENLFHPQNDSLTRDDEFTPEGSKKWNYYRYEKKLLGIYKVLMAMGKKMPPDIIGLCEIENVWTLHDLLKKTPLVAFNYNFLHKESPDERGIDVAFLYNKDILRPLHYDPIQVNISGDKTRDVLYVKGILHRKDTFHFFVNHWPSRWGGQLASEPDRIFVANLLKQKVDSLLGINKRAKILIMGDFNDTPNDKSIRHILQAGYNDHDGPLLNLMEAIAKKGQGTITTTSPFTQWHIFDQLICSKSVFEENVPEKQAFVFSAGWMLDKNGRPYRTYLGPVYKGGFSDHLPVYVDLQIK